MQTRSGTSKNKLIGVSKDWSIFLEKVCWEKIENALTRWSNATIGVRTKVYKVMPRLTDGFYYALGMHIPYGSMLTIESSGA